MGGRRRGGERGQRDQQTANRCECRSHRLYYDIRSCSPRLQPCEIDSGYLRARNPEWGIRDLEDVIAEAAAQRFTFVELVEMPANNLSVLLRRM
ncbi:MAG TPA: DUF938 domain-containing protein [Burkholderiales bacterium]|nr:DUF938 domain-containing protein [Burkholderiales bacterium]